MTWPMYRAGLCWYRGGYVNLGPIEAEVVSTLLMRRGCVVPIGALLESTYADGDSEPEWGENSVRKAVCFLRRKLPGLIQNEGYRGYFIDLPTDQRMAA